MDAAGNGAASESTGTGESNRTSASASGDERYDGTAGIATGSSAEADRSALSAGHGQRLHEAEEPFLEPDCALHGDECARTVAGKPSRSDSIDEGWKDLSEPGGCRETWAGE